MKVQNNMHDWIRYVLYTGAEEHENQPVQNKTTGRPPRGLPLQLAVILHKGLVFSLERLNFALSGPPSLQKHIQELVEKFEKSDVIPTNHNCRAESDHTLSYQ